MIDISPIPAGVDLAPGNVAAEIIQNVRTILTLELGSAPLNRNLGLDCGLDDPMSVATAKARAAIVVAIAKGEPRAKVAAVKFQADPAEGRLIPIVRLNLE